MEICDDGHEEIVFDSRKCPLCEALNSLNGTEEKVLQLEEEIEDLKRVR